ncbi:50S ribosomal protein L28-1 [Mycobacterium tuberculosis]|nr:50S ribosomal protein L28-1 [Mycobacterium tuberculosis]
MSARCQITGRTVGFGKAVSHSHRRTRRRWPPNIQLKAYYFPSEDRRIKVRVRPKESRSSTATGIEAVVARLGQDPPRRTSRAKRAHRSERRRSCEHN